MFKRFFVEEDGATMVEYGVMVALIAAISVAIVGTLGQQVSAAFTTVSGALP
ncbi:MAG: Flp family type IVb pilin [Chloroflexota bacterium]